MAAPKKLLLLGGLAALAAVGISSTASASTGSGGGAGGKPTGDPDDESCYDAHLPADIRAQIEQMLSSTKLTQAEYEQAAAAASAGGFPKAAACLRQRGKDRRAAAELELQQKGGMPHVIRYGDIPSMMANYYTGSPQRFKELGPLNPQIGQLKTVNGVTNYTNWAPGVQILIPKAWNPLDKPVPPPASGGGGGAAAQSEGDGWVDIIEDMVEDYLDDPEGGQSVPPPDYTPAPPEPWG